ncbi:transposase is4 [Holotrichia oblita]|uniref:Transposase is4 n=1 Tax=Holotrichia oblita TaxID=644536 RepID=A0ACB9TMX0_HOLOL|nr:transposase is4 [Holotrichia oblita]
MHRNRFFTIMRYMHCADNSNADPLDKLWKIRPLMDRIKDKCKENFIPEEQLSYDESMIKYYGKHGCKQFIRGKPIRFGYKMWCLNTVSGYLIDFAMYQGLNPRRNENYEQLYGKATAPLVVILDELPKHVKYLRYNIYFDNLFTGVNLLCHLKSRGYGGTGTMRDNRVPKSCPLLDKKTMKSESRGVYHSILDLDDGILLLRWADNGVVSVASTVHGVLPISAVRRYS